MIHISHVYKLSQLIITSSKNVICKVTTYYSYQIYAVEVWINVDVWAAAFISNTSRPIRNDLDAQYYYYIKNKNNHKIKHDIITKKMRLTVCSLRLFAECLRRPVPTERWVLVLLCAAPEALISCQWRLRHSELFVNNRTENLNTQPEHPQCDLMTDDWAPHAEQTHFVFPHQCLSPGVKMRES